MYPAPAFGHAFAPTNMPPSRPPPSNPFEAWTPAGFRTDDANQIGYLFPADGPCFASACNQILNSANMDGWVTVDRDSMRMPVFPLSFNPGPKDGARQGFLLGTDSSCDIGLPNVGRISPRHCCLRFRPNGQFIVQDVSQHGTVVTYGNAESNPLTEKRRNFEWVIGGAEAVEGYDKIVIEVDPEIRLQIVVNRYNTTPSGHGIDRFLREAAVDGALHLKSIDIQNIPSGEPAQNPVYLFKKRLGEGGFGYVDCVCDASDGSLYASKGFFRDLKSNWRTEASILKTLSHVSKISLYFHRDILTSLQPNIVKLIHIVETPQPRLIFEYIEFGSLHDLARKTHFSPQEASTSQAQILQALIYLAENGLAHRDIKPANLLLRSRDPWQLVLADFGLSKLGTDFSSKVGTYPYMAPELFGNSAYTSVCDIWSLGVVMAQFSELLPACRYYEEGTAWCEKILTELRSQKQIPIIKYLLSNMLVMNPAGRRSAAACLEAMHLGHQTSKRPVEEISPDYAPATVGLGGPARGRQADRRLSLGLPSRRPAKMRRRYNSSR